MAAKLYDSFLQTVQHHLEARIDRNLLCREALCEIYTGESRLRGLSPQSADSPSTENLRGAHFDPRNVTIEAERYGDVDTQQFAMAKPLLWLWYGFDRSPLGMNLHFGFKLRALLARYLFKRCGERVNIFPLCELSFGYNMEVGDDVVIHRGVVLDDRAGISIGNRSSISDHVAIYSHTHDVNEQELVSNRRTIIEDDCRIAYHATILAGSRIRRGSMVGAGALVIGKETAPAEVWAGVPARKIGDKAYLVEPRSGQRLAVEVLRDSTFVKSERDSGKTPRSRRSGQRLANRTTHDESKPRRVMT